MKNDARRVVLGFYATDEEHAQQAWRAIRQDASHAYYYSASGVTKASTPVSEKYSRLRLNDEDMVVVEVDSTKVPAVVSILRTSGEPGVFVVRPDEFSSSQSTVSVQKPVGAGLSNQEPTIYSWRGILDRLKECEAIIKSARTDLIEATRLDHAVTESAKWLLDNTYLLRGSIAEIRRSLPRGFRQALARSGVLTSK